MAINPTLVDLDGRIAVVTDLASYITGQTIHVDGGTAVASGWYHHPGTGQYTLGPPEAH